MWKIIEQKIHYDAPFFKPTYKHSHHRAQRKTKHITTEMEIQELWIPRPEVLLIILKSTKSTTSSFLLSSFSSLTQSVEFFPD